LRGTPVLLVFYPGDDTYGCRKQLCEIRDSWQALRARGVAVFGVNPQSAASHEKFGGKYGFPFPILVDSGQRIARLYRASGLMVKRTVVLIDTGGTIVFSERGMPSPDKVLAALPPAESLPETLTPARPA
jgi:peroxiredoxin Q/BCP